MTYPHFGSPLLANVSKRVRDESVLAYYQNIRLSFPSTKALMDYLTSIDSATGRQLRHISVRGHPFPISTIPDDDINSYPFYDVLLLFPGLKLSTLEVRDTYHEPGTYCDTWGQAASYHDVEALIKCDGFRELIYVSSSDRFLKFDPEEDQFSDAEIGRRDPQPSTWDRMIKARDGTESGAEARIYRVTKKGPVELKTEFETVKDFHSGQIPAFDEPIEVHVKRGKGVNYTQTGKWALPPEEAEERLPLKTLFNRLTWEEVKRQGLYYEVDDSSPCSWL